MKAEKRTEIVLICSEAEAAYLRAIFNTAPSKISELLGGRYSVEDIVRITKHSSKDSMWNVLAELE